MAEVRRVDGGVHSSVGAGNVYAAPAEGARRAHAENHPHAVFLAREELRRVVGVGKIGARGQSDDLGDCFFGVEKLVRKQGVAACRVGGGILLLVLGEEGLDVRL